MKHEFIFNPLEDLIQNLKQCVNHLVLVELHQRNEMGGEKINSISYSKLTVCEIRLDIDESEMEICLDGVPANKDVENDKSFFTSYDFLLPYEWWDFRVQRFFYPGEDEGKVVYQWSIDGPANTLTVQSPYLVDKLTDFEEDDYWNVVQGSDTNY